jgi:type I restriction enzyme S subunit
MAGGRAATAWRERLAVRAGEHLSEPRLLRPGDVLVNSTGVGTLGRVSTVRWLPEPATVDSHVTVVRPDAAAAAPAFVAWTLRMRQAEIEALAEGSTGQTELSRARLGDLAVTLRPRDAQDEFAKFADALEAQIGGCEREVLTLTALRDGLLPKLVSGEIRVPDTADLAEVIEPMVA